jgi:hypothetical protein
MPVIVIPSVAVSELSCWRYLCLLTAAAYQPYTVMPLRCIIVALFPVWKWDRGQVLFNAEEIQSASYNPENC